MLLIHLVCVWEVQRRTFAFQLFFFFFFFFEPKCLTFFVNSERCALFINPQISLFNNFFIKNGSHSAIYTFKNYFAIVFFSFQFLAISKRTRNSRASLLPAFIYLFYQTPISYRVRDLFWHLQMQQIVLGFIFQRSDHVFIYKGLSLINTIL